MSYYDQEFYHEPSEFEVQMEEFKSSIMKSVKEEFVTEMERLKKENEGLQEIKNNFEQIKNDYANKERQLERERKNMESRVRQERLSSLMKDFEVVMYKPNNKKESLPKCDKCDERRQIKYKTPLGKDTHEMCDCSVGKIVYFPQEYICTEFKINRYKNSMNMWYKMNSNRDEDYASFNSSIFAEDICNENMEYESVSYGTFFKTEEECQKYCDYLNDKNSKIDSSSLA